MELIIRTENELNFNWFTKGIGEKFPCSFKKIPNPGDPDFLNLPEKLKNILKGLNRITLNKMQMADELDNHWEVMAEAIQTILRKTGNQDAYEQLKKLTQGQSISKETILKFVSGLNISENDKQALMNLTPESFIGLAPKLVDLI